MPKIFLKSNLEIDFYIEQENTAIQVSYTISNIDTREREVDALLSFAKKNKNAKLMIITKEQRETIVVGDHEISVMPIAEWLLGF